MQNALTMRFLLVLTFTVFSFSVRSIVCQEAFDPYAKIEPPRLVEDIEFYVKSVH